MSKLQVESITGLFNNTAPPPWVIEGLCPEESITLVSALGHTGKTFFALEAMAAVATGRPFLGQFETKQGTALYVGEDSPRSDITKQLWKLLRGHELRADQIPEDSMLFAINEGADLSNDKVAQDVADLVFKYTPDLLVLDSLKALAAGADENDNSEADLVMGRIRGLAQIGPAVLLLHHNALGANRSRGAGAIQNRVDGHLNLSLNKRRGWVDVRIDRRRTIEVNNFAYYHYWDLESARLEFVPEEDLPDPVLGLIQQVLKEQYPKPVTNAHVIEVLRAQNGGLGARPAEQKALRTLQQLERKNIAKKVSRGLWVFDPESVPSNVELRDQNGGS